MMYRFFSFDLCKAKDKFSHHKKAKDDFIHVPCICGKPVTHREGWNYKSWYVPFIVARSSCTMHMCLSHAKKYPASNSRAGRGMVALVHLCIHNTIPGPQQMYDQHLLDERMNETLMPMVHTCNETFILKKYGAALLCRWLTSRHWAFPSFLPSISSYRSSENITSYLNLMFCFPYFVTLVSVCQPIGISCLNNDFKIWW